jgi:hypothetical protein
VNGVVAEHIGNAWPHAAIGCRHAAAGTGAAGRARRAETAGMSNDYADGHVSPRTLAGATILQIVPTLRETPTARTAVNVAHALVQSGARA